MEQGLDSANGKRGHKSSPSKGNVFDNNLSHKRLHDESEIQETEDQTKNNEDDDDVILFIEYKYCTVCHIE